MVLQIISLTSQTQFHMVMVPIYFSCFLVCGHPRFLFSSPLARWWWWSPLPWCPWWCSPSASLSYWAAHSSAPVFSILHLQSLALFSFCLDKICRLDCSSFSSHRNLLQGGGGCGMRMMVERNCLENSVIVKKKVMDLKVTVWWGRVERVHLRSKLEKNAAEHLNENLFPV